jgi:hypothetical protein
MGRRGSVRASSIDGPLGYRENVGSPGGSLLKGWDVKRTRGLGVERVMGISPVTEQGPGLFLTGLPQAGWRSPEDMGTSQWPGLGPSVSMEKTKRCPQLSQACRAVLLEG